MDFFKYTGAGNDFIIIDNYEKTNFIPNDKSVKQLCNRYFGIGADGLMIIKKHPKYDFEMEYFNSDGSGGTMCGNGGRCIVAYAKKKGIIEKKALFKASDGLHEAVILNDNTVKLKMIDVEKVKKYRNDYICNTGSPHYIIFTNNIDGINVYKEGQNVRFSEKFKKNGINVNFAETTNKNTLKIRTYERGVENETLACGTGAVAVSLTHAEKNNLKSGKINLSVKGGKLTVDFKKTNKGYTDIWLSGPADFIFKGQIKI